MDSTDLLITILIISVVTVIVGCACWAGESARSKRQQDWNGEGNARGIR